MAALLTKHSVVPTFKKTGASLEESFVKRKRSLLFGISIHLSEFTKSICLILPNYYLISPIISGGKKGHTYLNKPAVKRSRLVF